MINFLMPVYNFTWFCDTDLDQNWGTIPLSGNWNDPNVTFGGVMGNIINDEYDMSPTTWLMQQNRQPWMSFTASPAFRSIVLVFNLGQTPTDFTLFLRPFKIEVKKQIAPHHTIFILSNNHILGMDCLVSIHNSHRHCRGCS